MIIWVSFLVWCVFSIVEGIRDGIFYFHYNHKFPRTFNEHIIFIIERSLMAGVLIYVTNWWFIIPMVLSFSFIHNGVYYTTRNHLDNNLYEKKFWDQSETSTSIFTDIMTPLVRTVLFLLSLVSLLIINYL
ncbi:hypothetical protein COB55_04420 [Candidatus Wolfebacteria bacterium]|nr:MAG: hypothetical protein COB55_04420 [Candidatus Wolfebacteria bacterium]